MTYLPMSGVCLMISTLDGRWLKMHYLVWQDKNQPYGVRWIQIGVEKTKQHTHQSGDTTNNKVWRRKSDVLGMHDRVRHWLWVPNWWTDGCQNLCRNPQWLSSPNNEILQTQQTYGKITTPNTPPTLPANGLKSTKLTFWCGPRNPLT